MDKQELNTEYGKAVTQETLASFRICSTHVRRCRCFECLHYLECRKNGAPVPDMARFIAWLEINALPIIEAELNKMSTQKIRLYYCKPSDAATGRVYASIRCAMTNNARIFRLNLETPSIEFEELRTRILNAFMRGMRKRNNGK